jgi:hypothetical protein
MQLTGWSSQLIDLTASACEDTQINSEPLDYRITMAGTPANPMDSHAVKMSIRPVSGRDQTHEPPKSQ